MVWLPPRPWSATHTGTTASSGPGGYRIDQATVAPERAAEVNVPSTFGPGGSGGVSPAVPQPPAAACNRDLPGSTPTSTSPTPAAPSATTPAPPPIRNWRRLRVMTGDRTDRAARGLTP